jgi:hypothetical protein
MSTNPTNPTTDPLAGYDPDEIVVGPGGQTLAQAAAAEKAAAKQIRMPRSEFIVIRLLIERELAEPRSSLKHDAAEFAQCFPKPDHAEEGK